MNREDLCSTNTFLEMLCEVDVCDAEALVFSSSQNSKLLLPLATQEYMLFYNYTMKTMYWGAIYTSTTSMSYIGVGFVDRNV